MLFLEVGFVEGTDEVLCEVTVATTSAQQKLYKPFGIGDGRSFSMRLLRPSVALAHNIHEKSAEYVVSKQNTILAKMDVQGIGIMP